MELTNKVFNDLRKTLLMVEEGGIPINKVPYHKWIAEKISGEPYAQYTKVIHEPQIIEEWWSKGDLNMCGEIIERNECCKGEAIKIKLAKEGDFIACTKKEMVVLISKATYEKYKDEYEHLYLLKLDKNGENWISKLEKAIGQINCLIKETDLSDPEDSYSSKIEKMYKTKNEQRVVETIEYKWCDGSEKDTYITITVGNKVFKAHSKFEYTYDRDRGLEAHLNIEYSIKNKKEKGGKK